RRHRLASTAPRPRPQAATGPSPPGAPSRRAAAPPPAHTPLVPRRRTGRASVFPGQRTNDRPCAALPSVGPSSPPATAPSRPASVAGRTEDVQKGRACASWSGPQAVRREAERAREPPRPAPRVGVASGAAPDGVDVAAQVGVVVGHAGRELLAADGL